MSWRYPGFRFVMGALALVALVIAAGCGSDSNSSITSGAEATSGSEQKQVSAENEPEKPHPQLVKASQLTAKGPARRVMQCIKLEGGFIEPLAPTRSKREPPSRSFAHGVGPGETHIAIYLGVSPKEIDDWIESFNELGEYHAMKTPDGRNLILVDGYAASNDHPVAFHCVAVATR